jgi:DNA-binding response OmpR family regulator
MSLIPIEHVEHRVLLVDDDAAVLEMMTHLLSRKGFDVVAATSVTEALGLIATQKFDVLITDLHMPNPGDGFTVITAMRHSQPDALTMLVSGYPDIQSAMAAIVLEADEIIVKPFDVAKLAALMHEKMLNRKPKAQSSKERVGVILQRCVTNIIEVWLVRAKQNQHLNNLSLSDAERAGHLPKLVEDVALRLSQSSASDQDSDARPSSAAVVHGELRFRQGYTPAMLVHESRLLQVAIFGTLQKNLNHLDFSLLLPDVMAVADEIDSQLTQSMESYMKFMPKAAAA